MQDPTQPTNQIPTEQIPGVTPPSIAGMTPPPTGVSTDPMAQFSSAAQINLPQQPGVSSAQPGLQPAQSAQVTDATTTPGAVSAPAVSDSTNSPVSTPAATEQATSQEKKADVRNANGQPQVLKANIEKVVSSWTGIPITKLTEDEGAKLLNLENRVHQRLIDQEEAVTAVAEAVRRGRIGLAAANRPIASFIFLGPSGTGKTELAKTVAEILFGRDDLLVRLDMSEYMEKHEVAKLIGAPPGYVGYEEGGQLTEAVRAKPYSIVLLDEVEKAHPDVFNILLQVLEDGRLTDNKGNTISFKNTIVICTSNIGSAMITQKLGEKDGKPLTQEEVDKSFGELTTDVNGELRKFFRPELLNRFDDIVIFKPLRRQDMAAIAKLGIEKTNKLLKEQEIKLTVSDKALQQLALEGYDPMYGARPLRRLIQTSIENPIAVLIIAKTFASGDTIMIDYDSAKADYSFKKATPEEVAAATKKEKEEKAKKEGGKEPGAATKNTKETASADATPAATQAVTPPTDSATPGLSDQALPLTPPVPGVSSTPASSASADTASPTPRTNGVGLGVTIPPPGSTQ